jgi:hypothetical protein
LLKDVSSYDYIQFHVYNPNATEMYISTVWKAKFTIPAKDWGTVTLYVSDIKAGSIVDAIGGGGTISATNITNVCFYVRAMNLGESVYVSSIVAGNNA